MDAISIFSGIGALDYGLAQAGFRIVVQAEADDSARDTLKANSSAFPSRLAILGDVSRLTAEHICAAARLNPDSEFVLVGGPPCQSYSTAGTRNGWQDERGGLVGDYMRLLKTLRPRAFIFENVVGFSDAQVDDESLLGWFLNEAVRAGYAVTWGILNAVDYGAPQHRERFLILGSRLEFAPCFPMPSDKPRRTLRDALHDLDETICGLGAVAFSESKADIMRLIPEGGNWRDLPDEKMFNAMGHLSFEWSGKTGYWRRLSWDQPSPTVVSRPDHRATGFCHPDELRPLSVRECARLQCLPDWWDIKGSLYSRYRQVGDVVPVSLGVALGHALQKHLSGSKLARMDGMPLTLRPRTGRNRTVGLWGWSKEGRLFAVHQPMRA